MYAHQFFATQTHIAFSVCCRVIAGHSVIHNLSNNQLTFTITGRVFCSRGKQESCQKPRSSQICLLSHNAHPCSSATGQHGHAPARAVPQEINSYFAAEQCYNRLASILTLPNVGPAYWILRGVCEDPNNLLFLQACGSGASTKVSQ